MEKKRFSLMEKAFNEKKRSRRAKLDAKQTSEPLRTLSKLEKKNSKKSKRQNYKQNERKKIP